MQAKNLKITFIGIDEKTQKEYEMDFRLSVCDIDIKVEFETEQLETSIRHTGTQTISLLAVEK